MVSFRVNSDTYRPGCEPGVPKARQGLFTDAPYLMSVALQIHKDSRHDHWPFQILLLSYGFQPEDLLP